mgnify:FL=1
MRSGDDFRSLSVDDFDFHIYFCVILLLVVLFFLDSLDEFFDS